MRKRKIASYAVGMILVFGSAVCAMSFILNSEGPVTFSGQMWSKLPPGVSELASSRNRVRGVMGYGLLVNNVDLWYAGDEKAFNQFLAQYARLQKLPLFFVVHPAPGSGLRKSGLLDLREHYDWRLAVSARESNTEYRNGDGYAAVLHVYLSDAVTLDDIQVPAGLEVTSGGEIEQFVARHQSEQRTGRVGSLPKE